MKIRTIFIALSTCICATANAGFYTADQFLAAPIAAQIVYVMAISDTYAVTSSKYTQCVPNGVTAGTLRDIAVKAVQLDVDEVRAFPEEHPLYSKKEFLLSSVHITIRNAIMKHYGCKVIQYNGRGLLSQDYIFTSIAR